MVKLPKLKTKPKRTIPVTSCALELSSLLQCWATTNDLQSIGACSEVAKNLSRCMVTAKAAPAQRADSINFHLARLGKNFRWTGSQFESFKTIHTLLFSISLGLICQGRPKEKPRSSCIDSDRIDTTTHKIYYTSHKIIPSGINPWPSIRPIDSLWWKVTRNSDDFNDYRQ